MRGLSFETTRPVARAHPARADIALVVGWTTRRPGAVVPRPIAEWLRANGHVPDRRYEAHDWTDRSLRGLPLPIDDWPTFDALFDWHARPVKDSAGTADDWCGLALRDFFANGGRKAWFVPLGRPWPLGAVPDRDVRRATLLAGIRQAWTLDEVALVLVPDLPEFCIDAPPPLPGDPRMAPTAPEVFVECGTEVFATPAVDGVRRLRAPRLDDHGFFRWNTLVDEIRATLARQRRDVMLLLAAPLATRDSQAAKALGRAVRIEASQVQCATPWLKPLRSVRTPEGLVPPDGALAGLVAASVLAHGPVRPASGQAPQGVMAVEPQPRDVEWRAPDRNRTSADLRRPGASRADWPLAEVFALFGPTADGIRLLSDPSLSALREWRSAGVVRLLGQLLRTARIVGATLVFEPAGEALWARVRDRFTDLLTRYWQAGALRGATADAAFSVRCDRGTTTQNDIDGGRVVVQVEFAPQAAIESVRVSLALAEDGSVHWQDAAALDDAVRVPEPDEETLP